MNLYEISVIMPNGDTRWRRIEAVDYHEACYKLLHFAIKRGGRAERIERIPSLSPTPTPGDPA